MPNVKLAVVSLLLLVLAVSLVTPGCQQSNGGSAYPGPVAYPGDALPPLRLTVTPSKAVVIGHVVRVSNDQRKALAKTSVRLAKVQWNEQKTEGIFVLDTANSPGALTRADGSFAFANIEPGDYVIIVGDVIGVHTVISEPDGRARIYTAEPDRILDVGTLEVHWD